MEDLKGKIALITGSSRGIGAGIARLFAANGLRVVLHGRDKEALSKIHSEIRQAGGDAIFAVADVTKFDEIEIMRQKIEEQFGPVEILVANAGGSFTPPVPFEELPEDGWNASLNGNLTSTFMTIKSFLPGMKSRKKGNIITMSSAAGRRLTLKSPLPYAAAKAGIQLLTQALAAEVGPYGIRVNCIAPETILTEKNKNWISEETQKAMIEWHPVRRLGTIEDIAEAALFLASEQRAGWISGIILDVAGGTVF